MINKRIVQNNFRTKVSLCAKVTPYFSNPFPNKACMCNNSTLI